MKTWKFTCKEFKSIRNILKQYNNTDDIPTEVSIDILEKLQQCIKTISKSHIRDEDMYDDWVNLYENRI